METTTKSEFIEAYSIRSTFGEGDKFELKIMLGIGRDFTDEDKENIYQCAESLRKLICQETIRLDPKSKEKDTDQRKRILELFDGHEIFVEAIPNGYCSDFCCKHLHWFTVTTKLGRIDIGWRKRVIQIDWSGSVIKQTAEDLFASEDVTKGDKYIHAWGYEKAGEYIKTLLATKK